MLYVIRNDGKAMIILFETHTHSRLRFTHRKMENIINICNLELKNMSIVNSEFKLNKWPHGMVKNNGIIYYNMVLLTEVENNKFKVVDADYKTCTLDGEQLRKCIKEGNISNCTCKQYEESDNYMSIDTYETKINNEFIEYVNNEYRKFRAKSKMVGVDMGFEYAVEGREVKLLNYTGTSKNVMVPKFITSIVSNAFAFKGLESIQLNTGLEYIGKSSIMGNKLKEIEIPETVKIIFQDAFVNNSISMNKNNIRLKSNKTIVMDWLKI